MSYRKRSDNTIEDIKNRISKKWQKGNSLQEIEFKAIAGKKKLYSAKDQRLNDIWQIFSSYPEFFLYEDFVLDLKETYIRNYTFIDSKAEKQVVNMESAIGKMVQVAIDLYSDMIIIVGGKPAAKPVVKTVAKPVDKKQDLTKVETKKENKSETVKEVKVEKQSSEIKSIDDLETFDAKLFEKDSKTMEEISEKVSKFLNDLTDNYFNDGLSTEEIDAKIEEELAKFRAIVDKKRVENERRKGASIIKSKIAQGVKYKYKEMQPKVHGRNPYSTDEFNI